MTETGPGDLSSSVLPGYFVVSGHRGLFAAVRGHSAWQIALTVLESKDPALGRTGVYRAAAPLNKVVEYRRRRFGVELHCEQGTSDHVSLQARHDQSTQQTYLQFLLELFLFPKASHFDIPPSCGIIQGCESES